MIGLFQNFLEQLSQTTWLEFIAVIMGIASVWYSKQENILVFPTGIISVTAYIYITFENKLYADSGINLYYLIMSAFGWFNWKNTRDQKRKQIPITKSSKGANLLNVSVFIGATIFIYFILKRFTDSDVPLIDATTTGLAITAMYLMALKKIEHWFFWILCNLISIPMYIYKELPFTSFQFMVFTYIAILGLMSWRRKVNISDAHE